MLYNQHILLVFLKLLQKLPLKSTNNLCQNPIHRGDNSTPSIVCNIASGGGYYIVLKLKF